MSRDGSRGAKAPASAADVDAYIARFSPAVRARLRDMRKTIRKAAPHATERIAYGVPTFHMSGNLVHFAAFTNHVGFYPGPSGIAAFRAPLAKYKSAKGSVQFPHDEPLPLALVARIVKFRVAEAEKKEKR